MVKDIKTEIQALRHANKTQDKTFTHSFGGFGVLEFYTEQTTKPKFILDFGKATPLIYESIKKHPVEFYYRSYSSKYGKGVVPKELIDAAYDSATLDENNRLHITTDFSANSLIRKYQGKPEVRVVDDLVLQDDRLSILQCAFFHLYNTRLQDDKWCAFLVSLKYRLVGKPITFEQAKELLKVVDVIPKK